MDKIYCYNSLFELSGSMQIKKTNFQDKEYLFTNSFKPNLTSKLISDAIKCVDIKDKDILDLGCGCGALGLSLIEKKPKSILLADISKGAIDDCYSNINKHILRIKNINVEALLSDCFNNISPKKKYDLIINDISGISEDIALFSPWFDNAPCNSGPSGLKLFKKVITQAKFFLNDDGILFSPLLSLSNLEEAKSFLNTNVVEYKSLIKKNWFLPEDMNSKFKSSLERQQELGNIHLDYKFGKFIAWTQVLLIKKESFK